MARMGSLKRKVLVLLAAGLALGLNRSYKRQRWIWSQIPKELEEIDRQSLRRAIYSLYTSHLIEEKNHKDGSTTFILSNNGKQQALRFNIEKIKIQKTNKWDKKWRIVMFDIPEKRKKLREVMRFHFKDMGLIEFQKSVFISPYPCEKEVEFILEFYNGRQYVRFIVAEQVDNSLHFMKKFNLR
jgi:phenylacetic acid degradation operon negative regulatory protein